LSTEVRESVREFYNAYPFPGRLGAYGNWQGLAPDLLRSLRVPEDVLKDADVLDAGCGTGEYSRSFAAAGAHVTALDVSEGALAVARDYDARLGVASVDYQIADILNLNLDRSFDLIASLGVLHHTADPEAGFKKLTTVVRPGGYLVIGLYSSVSRLHVLTLRQILRVLSLGNQERAINLAQRFLQPILPLFIGKEGAKDRARIADLLAHPHEKPVSLYKTMTWCRQAGLEVIAGAPSLDPKDYGITRRFFRSPGRLACLLIQLRWIVWNADYYVISARRPER
jgi:2-polyprenyl-3-methyl-5-hydroxy-6-metoxy-1,4-benzoquinol methylase